MGELFFFFIYKTCTCIYLNLLQNTIYSSNTHLCSYTYAQLSTYTYICMHIQTFIIFILKRHCCNRFFFQFRYWFFYFIFYILFSIPLILYKILSSINWRIINEKKRAAVDVYVCMVGLSFAGVCICVFLYR